MDSNRKRRGLMKGKLMPFYRSAPKSAAPAANAQYTNKVVKPNMASPTAASVGFLVQKELVNPTQKVSFVNVQAPQSAKLSQKQTDLHSFFGVGDELVDAKAASYIFSVQERFKMERINSERMKHQDHADSLVN